LDSSNRFIAITSDFGAALQILPVDGGPPRQLTQGQEEDQPLAWTENNQILFSTQLNGSEVLLLAPATGGAMRQVSLPEKRRTLLNNRVPPPFLSGDGSHLFYEVAGDDPEFSVLKVLSLGSGDIQEITSTHPGDGPGVSGPGGVPHFNGPDFVYLERHGDRYELHAWRAEGESRLLRVFGVDERLGGMSVHGDRLLFAQYSEALASLRITTLTDPRSRELLERSGALHSVGWSPDGRHLAMVHVDTSGGRESARVARVAFLQLSPSGGANGDLRYASEPLLSWWNLRWLPDSRGVLATGWEDSNVCFFPVDPSENSVCLTEDEPDAVWDFVISPDGRHIVYPRRVFRGSTIWMVDLGEIPEPVGR
jgi:dipeptidyl aminopeptidase/acylaminoacyl peptidase